MIPTTLGHFKEYFNGFNHLKIDFEKLEEIATYKKTPVIVQNNNKEYLSDVSNYSFIQTICHTYCHGSKSPSNVFEHLKKMSAALDDYLETELKPELLDSNQKIYGDEYLVKRREQPYELKELSTNSTAALDQLKTQYPNMAKDLDTAIRIQQTCLRKIKGLIGNSNINVVSLNVGSEDDWANLEARKTLGGQINYQPIPVQTADEVRAHVLQQVTILDNYFKDHHPLLKDKFGIMNWALVEHKNIIETTIDNIMKQFSPDIFCIQEHFNPKSPLVAKLKDYNFTMIGRQNMQIAYNNGKFELINQAASFSEINYVDLRAAHYVDLKEITTRRIIRVVSDHVAGFDGVEYKIKASSSTQHYGDQALQMTLRNITNDKKLEAILFGLDANTTASYIPA